MSCIGSLRRKMRPVILLALPCASILGASASDFFNVGCVNCGAFHYNKKLATREEFQAEWSRLVKENPQDVFFYEDVGKGSPGEISLPSLDIRASAAEKPVGVDVVGLPHTIETAGGRRRTPRYRAMRLVFDCGGRKLAVYGVHLVAEGHIKGGSPELGGRSYSKQLRRIQFQTLVDDAKKFDFAILTGDFNAQEAWEYDVFREAGYSIANCSAEYGTQATLRNIPADNIIVSPGLSIAGFKVLRGYLLDTDHFPIAARVRLPSPSGSHGQIRRERNAWRHGRTSGVGLCQKGVQLNG